MPREPDISFHSPTRTVTVKLSIQDPNGHFIPNLRRNNFVVYEDGIRQRKVTVETEQAPVTLAVLLVGGGVSEANPYDALIGVLNRVRSVSGRKAVLLISTGIDRFSHATFEDVVRAAEATQAPVYCLGLADVAGSMACTAGPVTGITWKRASEQLEMLSKVSGGRAYFQESSVDIRAIYDDIMEHLRVRYVITYVSSNPASAGAVRTVRVVLVTQKTGASLRIVDADGRVVAARDIVQGSFAT